MKEYFRVSSKIIRLFFIIIIIFFLKKTSFSQEKTFNLSVLINEKHEISFLKKKNYLINFEDSLKIYKELDLILNKLYEKGYVSANFDSICFNNKKINVFLFIGKQYKWEKIDFSDLENDIILKLNLKEKKFLDKKLNYLKILKLKKDIINYYQNNAYPFAEVFLDSIYFSHENKIKAKLKCVKNNLISINKINLKGNFKLNSIFIKKYISVEEKDLYHENKIKLISKKIDELSFIEEIKPFKIEFIKNKANLFLYLKDKKANQFSGILGVMPNEKTSKKLLLTGEINLFLQNSFKKGEKIKLNWKKLESSSQELSTNFIYYYLFKTKFGLDFQFDLEKKDSTYLTTYINIGIPYFFDGKNYIKFFYENKNSFVFKNKDSLVIENQLENIKLNLYGIAYKYENLDYLFNPRKGISFFNSVSIGKKQSKIKSKQVQNFTKIKLFVPLFENFTFKINNETSLIYNDKINFFYENEMTKIGGLKTLRGFDEKSILASFYSIFSVEFRYIFEKNSNIYTFFDIAYYEKKLVKQNKIKDTPFGFGLGTNFETKAGIFSINYALGKQFNNFIELRSAKIHFGFINKF